jgi:hypothetical protein
MPLVIHREDMPFMIYREGMPFVIHRKGMTFVGQWLCGLLTMILNICVMLRLLVVLLKLGSAN